MEAYHSIQAHCEVNPGTGIKLRLRTTARVTTPVGKMLVIMGGYCTSTALEPANRLSCGSANLDFFSVIFLKVVRSL